MYTEGFENLEEAESESHRTIRSSSETERLLRENEKLKKSLEKEKFFNKLLDQEIQELKSSGPNGNENYSSDYWSGKRRISRGAFYTLLFITLVMAGYIGYGIYYDKKFDYLNIAQTVPGTKAASTTKDAEPVVTTPAATTPEATATNGSSNVNEQPKSTPSGETTQPASAPATPPPPAVKDSVPNIIGEKKPVAATQKQKAAQTEDVEYNEEEVNATLREEIKPVKRPSSIANKPAASAQESETTSTPVATATKPAEPRPVIAKYRVTSKANFYNSPDENTMRSTFISESANKTVNALEDKNGFIYVEYTNDLGFTSKGWLSKTDLTKE